MRRWEIKLKNQSNQKKRTFIAANHEKFLSNLKKVHKSAQKSTQKKHKSV